MLLSITQFIGHFHPLLVHLPIGILLIALLLQWMSSKEKYAISPEVIKLVLLTGLLSALLSCITGYLLSMSGEYDTTTVSWHMWMGIAVTIISMLLYVRVVNKQYGWSYQFLSIGLLFSIVVTGHLGGSLTHGSDYLTQPIAEFFGNDSIATVKHKPIDNIQEAKIFADVIQPILQDDCYSCHGKQKQKGNLRMDDENYLMKGGRDGAILVPGKANESELIKRILLPRGEEHHMPPKEKPQLNEKQIALLHWWIETGADFTKQVKQVNLPNNIKPLLQALQTGNESLEKKMPASIPTEPIVAADENAIQALRNKGIVVIPVAQNSHYLSVNFITASDITDKELALLKPIEKQLTWLKLGHTHITDIGLKYIAGCTALHILQLDHTAITDNGLDQLKGLTSLQSLNLTGTKVTSIGIKKLSSLKQLKWIYLYQTDVNKNDWLQLTKLFPSTSLDSGGYLVPLLASDTTVVQTPLNK